MGVDINTYRCRVGMFVSGGGCGLMLLFITFGRVVRLLGSLTLVRILLIIAGVEQNPGPTDKYIFRYQYLLVEIGTEVMRKVFDFKVGFDFVKHLSANNNKFNKKLQRLIAAKIITADQARQLPPINNSPQSTNLDITLLVCLLRNVCGLRGKNDPVWKNPQPSDHSLEADLARLKECRNNLQHRRTVFISEADLTIKWNELSQILNRLNYVCGISNLSSLINDAESMDIDEELKQKHDQSVKAWTDMDHLFECGIEELKLGQSEIKHGLAEIKYVQSEIKHGQSEIKHSQSEIKHGQSEIKHVQSEIIQGLSNLNVVQSETKHGLAEIKYVQSEIKHGQSEIKHSQSEIKHGQSEIKHGQSEIVQGLSNLNVVQSEMKHDQPILKKSLRNIERRQQEQTKRMKEISQRLYKRNPTSLEIESDLRNRLVKIYREECCTLLVSPLYDRDEDEVEILSIYKPPSLYHVPYNRTQEREEPDEKVEKYSISSYQEIFCKDDRSFRKIYITGDAGVGKTSLCRHMSFLWCKSQSGESVSDKSVQNDIDFIAKFDFVFYVSLRDTHRRDIVTMIVEQLVCNENDLKKKEIYEAVENILRKNECIIIMDGLDEWSPKESGKININQLLSDKCIFVITCRPYKIENERLSPRDIDRQVQITGINESSIKRYVTEIFNHIDKANRDNKNPDDFMRDVKECGLHGQLHIPIITSHLVVLWFDHKLTDMSRAHIYSNVVDMLLKRAEKGTNIELPSPGESEVPFPDSLSELFYFKRYISFLKKICLLSFNLLFQQDKCLSELAFTTEQLESEPYCVSPPEMDFLCKSGILSKSKVIGRFGKRQQKLSYLHKTYLEYFAALFVSSFDLNDAFDNVVKKWTSINDVVKFEKFLLFFCGLVCSKNNFLFENIYHAIADNLEVCRRNAIFHYDSYFYRRQIKSLETVFEHCLKEVSGSNDSSVQNFNSDYDLLKQFHLLNTCIESIHSVVGKYHDEFDQVKNLQYLYVGRVLSGDYVKFTECMLKNQSTLHTVCIKDNVLSPTLIPELPVKTHHGVAPIFKSLFNMEPVRSLQHLTSLSLSGIKMEHNSLHKLVKFLSDIVLIENIKLSYVSCDNHQDDDRDCTLTLHLPHHTKLTSLCLMHVNILSYNVNNSSLKSITLSPLSELSCSCFIDVFKCIKVSQLEHLEISGGDRYMLGNNSKIGYGTMLGNNTMLGYNTMLDFDTMKTLTCTLKTLPYIKSLSLRVMKLPDDVLLQLHPNVTQLEEILLYRVTMGRQCFQCFTETLINTKSGIKVQLDRCNIISVVGDTHRELSEAVSVDYMSEYLTSLTTVNITFKHGGWFHFETRSCK